MSEAMAKADFPTQDMIDEIEKELRMFKFFYQPHGGSLMKTEAAGETLSVEELEMVVKSTLGHLKKDLIPKLQQIDQAVQKRNTWLECQARNKHQNAVFEAENDLVHDLIVSEKDKTESTLSQAKKHPVDVIDKAI